MELTIEVFSELKNQLLDCDSAIVSTKVKRIIQVSIFESGPNESFCVTTGTPPPPQSKTHTLRRAPRDEVNFTGTCRQTDSGFMVKAMAQRRFFPEILQAAANFSEPQTLNKPPGWRDEVQGLGLQGSWW